MKVPANAVAELDRAIKEVEDTPGLPARDEVLAKLHDARRQAVRALEAPLQTSSAALGREDAALSLALSAESGPAPPPSRLGPAALVGLERYEDLDVRWLGAFYHYVVCKKVEFPIHDGRVPAGEPGSGVIHVADDITLAMAGDWGTGNASSAAIAARIEALEPRADFTLHLGDVYYSGTEVEERARFVTLWPRGAGGAFALNSNHEMYSGGVGYFGVALADPKFSLQRGLSYFALENARWIVFGLDSAYPSDAWLYEEGRLDSVQVAFLETHARRAIAAGKQVMVLTHHQPIEFDGRLVSPLCDQVIGAVGARELTWYWGHIHGAAVLEPKFVDGTTIHGRCVGHGGVPYEPFDTTPAMQWTEMTLAGDPDEPRRALNGFVVVRLAGAELRESFIGEDGSVRYTVGARSSARAA